MSNYPFLGPAAPDLGWVPAPRYLLRRDRVCKILKELSTGRLLEIGPGAGALLVEFTAMGFKCAAIESSPDARKLTKSFLEKFNITVPLHETENSNWDTQFDVVCAFDVLEHIENDQKALKKWASWLKPGKVLILSVPAHMKRWNSRDEWAGHYRRYERKALIKLLEKTGFCIEMFQCYGFPLANITEAFGTPIYRLKKNSRNNSEDETMQRGTDLSGIDRKPDLKIFPYLNSVPGKLLMCFFLQVQCLFMKVNWGNGYIVKAIKKI